MWILFGLAAAVTAVLNLVYAMGKKANKWFGFCSLAFTSLTLCAFYGDAASYVVSGDWGALEDILPTVSRMLWAAAVVSISVNAVPLMMKASIKD